MDKKKAFGQFIYKRRMDRGLTQQQVADAVDKPRAYISQIETGKRMPSDELMQNLIFAVGASMSEFTRELLADTMPAEQLEAVAGIMGSVDALQEVLSPELMMRVMAATPSIEQLSTSLAVIGGVPLPPAPSGWTELTTEDRRLVQRLINRLLKGAKSSEVADDGDD